MIFVGVEGTLLYTLVRFRKRKGRGPVQIHGNTRLEIGWTVGAAVVLIALAVLTFAELHSIRTPDASRPNGLSVSDGAELTSSDAIKPPKGPYLTIQVNGRQYVWQFVYLRLRQADRRARRPLHLLPPRRAHQHHGRAEGGLAGRRPLLVGSGPRRKVQAVPGYTNWTWFKISKPGNYFGQCAFLCGEGHATMRAEVTACRRRAGWLAAPLEAQLAVNKVGGAVGRAALNNRTGSASVENP